MTLCRGSAPFFGAETPRLLRLGPIRVKLQDGMVTVLSFLCLSPRVVMGKFSCRLALSSWPDHVRSGRARLGGLSA